MVGRDRKLQTPGVVVANTLASPWEVSGASWLKSMSLISVPGQLSSVYRWGFTLEEFTLEGLYCRKFIFQVKT